MRKLRRTLVVMFLAAFALHSCNQPKQTDEATNSNLPAYKNTALSFDERVNDLVGRMTLEEKVAQTLYNSPAIERLDVPEYNWWNECLHGVARAGFATVFPQAIGMAAMWDAEEMDQIAQVVSDEARAKHHEAIRRGKRGIYQGLTFWTPNINIFRDPRWGRGMETYGEDPYLTGEIATHFIKGLQGTDSMYLKTIATAKHFVVHSGPEPDRHIFNATTNKRDFYETYLPAFRRTIVDAKAYSVMCAYNRYNDEVCCGSNYLLDDILRRQWHFGGYVVSDCWAVRDFYDGHNIVKNKEEASALALRSGTDLNCGDSYGGLVEAVKQGLISEEEIDVAVKRLFLARFKLGMFDGDKVPYAAIPFSVVECDAHSAVAADAARKSMVLLKNKNNILPLSKDVKNVAVIGPNANDIDAMLGNYNGYSSKPVTPFEGIKNKLPQANVQYALGCAHADNLPVLELVPTNVLFATDAKTQQGLQMEVFDNRKFTGTPVHTEICKNIDFDWHDAAPLKELDDDNFGIRWTGVFVPEVSGRYAFGGEGFSAFKVFIDDSLFVEFQSDHHSAKTHKYTTFEAGRAYKLRVEFSEEHGDAFMRLLWEKPGIDHNRIALDLAKKSDVVIMCMGLSPRLEGEEMKVEVEGFAGGDRLTLDLPKTQVNLMKKLRALNKPTILVLLNGSAVSINWADANIDGILEAWYPGQAAGTAIADVLFGDYNPAGRLPVTFYKSASQLPDFSDYSMKGRTYRYFTGDVLYNFGYGLSYTTFAYRNAVAPATVSQGADIEVKVEVENIGQMDGDEVVQLYVRDLAASAEVPLRSLQAFKRIALKKGERKTVTFNITPRQLAVVNDKDQFVVEAGEFEFVLCGGYPLREGSHVVAKTTVTGENLEIKD